MRVNCNPHHLQTNTKYNTTRRSFSYLVRATKMPPAFKVHTVPLFEDNYCYRIESIAHRASLLVDPADAAGALAAWARDADTPELVGVLTTHHHPDHSGGNVDVATKMPGIAIIGGEAEDGRIPAATRLVADGE